MRGQGSGAACPWNAASTCSLHWPEGSKGGEIKKCGRAGALLSKSNQQYHKLFKDIPAEETVLKVCSCALQRDLLLQGRLYISPNWLCFHASLFGKDIKVVIPVLSVQIIKKHKMARLLPNGLAITTSTSQKYVFVSLLSRDSVYDLLRRVCTHLQPCSKKTLSVRKCPEEPRCEPLVRAEPGSAACVRAPPEGRAACSGVTRPNSLCRAMPGGPPALPGSLPCRATRSSADLLAFREEGELSPRSTGQEVRIPEMKWRNVCPASRSLSLPDNIPCVPRAPTDSTDSLFPSRKPPGSEAVATAEDPLQWEPPKSSPELRLWDSRLLKVVFVLICFLVLASSYLAVRISRLEQQLCTFTWEGPVPGHR